MAIDTAMTMPKEFGKIKRSVFSILHNKGIIAFEYYQVGYKNRIKEQKDSFTGSFFLKTNG